MAKLSEPSKDLASRILREVDFEERFVGVKMTPMAGNRMTSIYSFQEAVDFLHMDSLEDLLAVGSHGSVGYLDLNHLKKWISDIFGDMELAEALDQGIGDGDSYMAGLEKAKDLMRERLEQCKAVTPNKAGL
jgi:hypothetical protein